jgi:hypothetical protein
MQKNTQQPASVIAKRTYRKHLQAIKQKARQVFQHEAGMGRVNKDDEKQFLTDFIANYRKQVN